MYGPRMSVETAEYTLVMRPYQEGDEVPLAAGMSNYEVTKTLGRDYGFSVEQEQQWLEQAAARVGLVLWVLEVQTPSSCEVIGVSSLEGFKERFRGGGMTATSGFTICQPEWWGKRVASTSHLMRTYYAFEIRRLVKVSSGALRPNMGSRKALERVGYVQTGVDPQAVCFKGRMVDLVDYLLLNPSEPTWQFFWDGQEPTKAYVAARDRTELVLQEARSRINHG